MEIFWRYTTVTIHLSFLPPESKPKPVKKKKRASRLSALKFLKEKSERKAKIKEQQLELRQREFEFQKQKYENEAAERKAKIQLELGAQSVSFYVERQNLKRKILQWSCFICMTIVNIICHSLLNNLYIRMDYFR